MGQNGAIWFDDQAFLRDLEARLRRLESGVTGGTIGGGAGVDVDSDVTLSFSDNTTNDVDTAMHGFCPKVTDTAKYLKGDGTWAAPAGAYYVADDNSTTSTSLVDITGLVAALQANSVYEFEAIIFGRSSTSAGSNFGLNFSAAGASVQAYAIGDVAAATTHNSDEISALDTPTIAMVGGDTHHIVRIPGLVTVGANAGNFSVKHSKMTSGTDYVYASSYLRLVKIS